MTPAAGQTITVGRLRFEVLWPPPQGPTTGNPNDFALVSRLEVGAFSMLLSADAESNVTQALALEPVDVLKVAHHGSADPGLPALLERLRPRLAAIEVGENTYGHPTPSTLAALAQAVPEGGPDRQGRHGPAARRRGSDVGRVIGPQADTSVRGGEAPESRPMCSVSTRAIAARSRNRHPSAASGDTVAAVSRIPSRKGLLNRENAFPCGRGRLVLLGGALAAPAAQADPSTTVVISKIMTRGPAGGNDEVIELKNKSTRARRDRRLAAVGHERGRDVADAPASRSRPARAGSRRGLPAHEQPRRTDRRQPDLLDRHLR